MPAAKAPIIFVYPHWLQEYHPMDKKLTKVIESIYDDYSDLIEGPGRNYLEIDIGKRARDLGFDDIGRDYTNVSAVIPIKNPVHGMKVRIDGRGFAGYVQFDTGLVVPGFVARESGLPYKTYIPCDSMVLNVH